MKQEILVYYLLNLLHDIILFRASFRAWKLRKILSGSVEAAVMIPVGIRKHLSNRFYTNKTKFSFFTFVFCLLQEKRFIHKCFGFSLLKRTYSKKRNSGASVNTSRVWVKYFIVVDSALGWSTQEVFHTVFECLFVIPTAKDFGVLRWTVKVALFIWWVSFECLGNRLYVDICSN